MLSYMSTCLVSLGVLLLFGFYQAKRETSLANTYLKSRQSSSDVDPNAPKTFVLPRIYTKWPWTRNLSEYYEVCKAESSAWVASFHPFEGHGLKAFRECNFSLLASLSYSTTKDKTIIRLGSDLMYLFFAIDEYTDVENRDGVERIHQQLKDLLENPNPSDNLPNDHCINRMAKDFWLRARAIVPEGSPCLRHFIEGWSVFTESLVQEADDRANRRYRSFEDYKILRRGTGAAAATFALIEFGLDIPEEVYQHPVLCSLREKAGLLTLLPNDIYSYGMEKSRGLEIHNGVEIIKHEQKISTQEAINWLANYCEQLSEEFLLDFSNLPSWNDETIDSKVSIYVNCLGQWVRGQEDWHFENERYFGSNAAIVKDTRIATSVDLPSHGYVTRRS